MEHKTWPGFEHGIGIGGWLTNYKRFNVLPDKWKFPLTTGDYEHFETYITESDIQYIASLKADHIRMCFDQIVLEEAPGVYRERTFALLDRFLDWCGKYGINVVMNLHKAIGNYSEAPSDVNLFDDEGLQERFAAFWCECERRWHDRPDVAPPELHFEVAPPEDQAQFATVINTLSQAGFKADAGELSERFGLKLTYEPPAAAGFGNAMSASDPEEDRESAHTLNLKQKYDAMGVAIRAGLLTATPEIEAQTRAELGLPSMSPEVQKAWEATGGIRQPITLKNSESEAVEDALHVDREDDAATFDADPQPPDEKDLGGALKKWLGPLASELADIAGDEDLTDKEFAERLAACADGKKLGDSKQFEQFLEGQIYDGFAHGATK